MVKEKRILSYILGWFLVGYIIFVIGTNNVFASTYNATQFTAQLYDNYGPSLHTVTTDFTNNRYQGIIPTMIANSSGAAWGISSPVTLVANHTYTLTAEILGPYGGRLVLSTYNRIGVGTTLNNAVTSYQNNTYVKEIYSKVQDNGYTIQFAFTPTINSSYIIFPFATNSSGDTQYFYLSDIVINDLGSESITEEQVTNSLNSQTDELNNSIQSSTNTITGVVENMGEDIKDSIKDNFNSCRDSVNLFNKNNPNLSYLNPINMQNMSGRSVILQIKPNTEYTISKIVTSRFAVGFTENYPQVGAMVVSSKQDNSAKSITINSKNGNYMVIYIYFSDLDSPLTLQQVLDSLQVQEGSIATEYEAYGEEICSNKIDETNDKLDETNDKLDGIQGALTDSSSPDIDSLADSAGWLPPGPLDSVLNLPLSLFNSLTTNLNKSCSPINVPLPYVNKNLTIPCINTLYEKIGISTFMTWIGVIASGFMLYTYLLKLYKWIEDRISLNETHSVDNWGGL